MTTELAAVREHAETLRLNFEDPDREAAVEKAMILAPAEMALWLRYEKMHDSMFHRAYNALERPEAAPPEPEPMPDPDLHDDEPASSLRPTPRRQSTRRPRGPRRSPRPAKVRL